MIANDESTWPPQLVACFEQHRDVLLAWEQERAGQTPHMSVSARDFDTAIFAIRAVLGGLSLRGYHCTRLTEPEIENILANGLSPQNRQKLGQRIDALVSDGQLTPAVAARLKVENQADDENRAGMIWFCFYEMNNLDQSATERLFRSWGGEALYNSHEDDPDTGLLLGRIGVPCIVEADVVIERDRHVSLAQKMARVFLVNRGFRLPGHTNHEGYSTIHIPAANIRRVIRFPDPDFMALTHADTWEPPL